MAKDVWQVYSVISWLDRNQNLGKDTRWIGTSKGCYGKGLQMLYYQAVSSSGWMPRRIPISFLGQRIPSGGTSSGPPLMITNFSLNQNLFKNQILENSFKADKSFNI